MESISAESQLRPSIIILNFSQASFKKMNSDTNLINNIPNNNVSGNFSQYNLSYNNYSSEQNGFNQTSNNSNVFSYNHSHNQNQNYGYNYFNLF